MIPQELVAGAAAGLVQDILMHPIDTLRARLDTMPSKERRVQPIRAFITAFRGTSLRALYGGYGVAVFGSVPANALYFGGYHFWRRALGREGGDSQNTSWWLDAVAGFGAEVCANVMFTPMDVVKQRLQVAPEGTPISHVVRTLVQQHGVAGFWRGYFAGLAVWGPYSATYFCCFEMLKDRFGGKLSPTGDALVFGVCASAIAAAATQPLDCAKTRVQVGTGESGVVGVMRTMLRTEGWAALMRGAGARVLWLAPGGGITLCVYESVIRQL